MFNTEMSTPIIYKLIFFVYQHFLNAIFFLQLAIVSLKQFNPQEMFIFNARPIK